MQQEGVLEEEEQRKEAYQRGKGKGNLLVKVQAGGSAGKEIRKAGNPSSEVSAVLG